MWVTAWGGSVMLGGVGSSRTALLVAALVTLIAWQFPYGRMAMYPFSLFATYAHEMGHGLTAILVGGEFKTLHMSTNGSGYATNLIPNSRIAHALVAAGGLVGPSVAGSTLLVISRWLPPKPILYGLGGAMAMSVLVYTRGAFAPVFVTAAAAIILAVAAWLPRFSQLFLQLLGVQLCIAVFQDLSYMFSPSAHMGVSDSEAIAQALFLPYWFWGGVVALFSFAVLGLGLAVALRPTPPKDTDEPPAAEGPNHELSTPPQV